MSPLTCAENLRRIELLVNVTTILQLHWEIVASLRARARGNSGSGAKLLSRNVASIFVTAPAATKAPCVRTVSRMLMVPAQMENPMDTDDSSAALGWTIRSCLAACLTLCILGCGPRIVRPPLPLTDSDAAHQDRATITVLSVDHVSPMGHWGRWNLTMTIEITATKSQIVATLGDCLFSRLYRLPARFVWITRSNGRDLWLGGAPELPDMISIQYRYLREHEVTKLGPDRFTATIQVSVPSYELPSGELTIAFDADGLLKKIGESEMASLPKGGIYCPAATLMAPAPTPLNQNPPQSGGVIGASP